MRLARDLERKEQGDGKDAQEIVLSQPLTPPCSGCFSLGDVFTHPGGKVMGLLIRRESIRGRRVLVLLLRFPF